jgi:hypothetical protein
LLERRDLMTAVNMSPYDQLLIELVNRARANPGAEASLFGIDLNAGLAAGSISYDAKQPLAPNQILQIAAGGHSDDMLANNYFSHTNLAGQSPSARAAAVGYPTWVGENIAWGGTTGSVDQILHTYQRHQGLFESSGHRQNIMNANYEEIGVGVRFGPYTYSNGVTYNSSMVTENFGSPGISPFITGVVYTDAADNSSNDDGFYSVGEQVSSGLITATNINNGATYTTDIGTSGGFALQAVAGTYNIVATSGVDGVEYLVANLVVSAENVKVDFETTTAAIANHAPTLEQLGQVTLYHTQTDFSRTLTGADADGDLLSYSVTVENLAAHLDQSLGLTTTSSVNENYGGLGEKWLAGAGNKLYYLTPSGQLFQWNGGGSSNLSGSLIASLDSSFHQNIQLLHTATTGLNGATASINGAELNVTTDAQFDGIFVVTVTVSDDINATEMSFHVAKGNQFSRNLDQELALSSDGDFREDWGGLQEKWLLGAGGQEYFMTPDGQFFRHDGSPQSNLTGTFVAQLDSSIYEQPWLLYKADNHYLDIALDLHINDRIAELPLDFGLLYEATADRMQRTRLVGNVGSMFAQPDARIDQPTFSDTTGQQSETARNFVFQLDGLRPNHLNKSLTASEQLNRSLDLTSSELGQELADDIFATWSF